jgi:hypothetical protein
MMTTDNDSTHGETPEEEAAIKHRNETGNVLTEEDNLTQEQINEATGTNPILDAPDQQKLDAVEGQERQPVDGNGLREHDEEDVEESVDTQAKQTEIAKKTQDKELGKLDHKPSASTNKA